MRSAARMPISNLLPDWMRAPTLPLLLGNELRAIFPLFCGAMAMVLLSVTVPGDIRLAVTMGGCALGCAGISAIAFGHDFAHRTLLATFAQPIPRGELWWLRMKAALLAIIPLTLVAGWALGTFDGFLPSPETSLRLPFPASAILLGFPLILGVCVAPFLTLLCRSPLAGAVFAVCLPFALFFGADYIWTLVFAAEPPNRTVFMVALGSVFVLISIASLAGNYLLWQRLQVIDANPFVPGLSFGRARARQMGPRRRASRWIQLALKELRLQWLALVPVAGMIATVLSFNKTPPRPYGIELLVLTTAFWAMLLCLVMGAVASAEERQMGVAESQALLPVSKARQWMLKLAIVIGVSQLLAVWLPITLLAGTEGTSDLRLPSTGSWRIGALCLVIVSLYVSSCCRTTMKAVLISLPLAAVVLAGIDVIRMNQIELYKQPSPRLSHIFTTVEAFRMSYVFDADRSFGFWVAVLAPYAFGAAVLVLLSLFACRNHFSAERGQTAVRSQLLLLASVIGIGVVIYVAASVSQIARY